MKNGIILAAFMAALCTSAETVKTATQPWVRAYVATNQTDISGKADKTNTYTKAETDARIVALSPSPGNYSTVSNRAMSAIQEHQTLEPSTNYTDAALGAFAATGAVARAEACGTPTRWTDATGCVWQAGLSAWRQVAGENDYTVNYYDNEEDLGIYWQEEGWYVEGANIYPSFASDNPTALIVETYTAPVDPFQTDSEHVEFVRSFSTNLVGRVALTNDVTAAIREQSLGGIWDQGLGVWWTPIMQNGALRYVATTNVNLNAGN